MADRAVCWESGCNVIGIRGPGEVRLVARITGRRCVYVVVVRVALDARQCCVRSCQRIVGIRRVIEGDSRPVGRVVTGVARSGECGRNVTGIRGTREIRLVTAVARRRQCRVVVIRVALRALQGCMCTRQREHRSMIESGRSPGAGRVAQSAVRGEARSHVSGVRGPCEVSLVAPVAGRRQCCVVVVGMALRTGNGRMRTSQRERRRVVIEGCPRPIRCRMASGAGRRETDCDVIGARRPCVIGLVA
jgi:hypothetical protein